MGVKELVWFTGSSTLHYLEHRGTLVEISLFPRAPNKYGYSMEMNIRAMIARVTPKP